MAGLGFMDTSGRQVIEIEHCVIVEETINQAVWHTGWT